MNSFTESIVGNIALAWLEALCYAVLHGMDISAGEPDAEHSDPNCRDVMPKTLIPGGSRVKDTENIVEALA